MSSPRPAPSAPREGEVSQGASSHFPVQPAIPTPAPIADKHVFGLRQDGPVYTSSQPIFSDDYEKRFPEDAYCEENGPNARVYRTYVEEAAAYDANMVGQSRDGLDVMLVFAGLFSAVVTSFLVQVSQSLQADYMQMSAVLLHDLVFIQLALADGVSVANITRPSVNPAQAYVADGITVWVNGLWVVSLVASLTVALVAVLAKQWLHHYVSLPSGTPKQRSHIRHFRFMGLEQWRVLTIIGTLPIVMHISLTLFLSGLILFFIPLRQSLAWAVGMITVVICVLHLVANAMPIFFPQCPYKTLFMEFLSYVRRCLSLASGSFWRWLRSNLMRILGHRNWRLRYWASYCSYPPPSLMAIETRVVDSESDTLSVDVFDWLFKISSNPSVRSIVLQALSGLPSGASKYIHAQWSDGRIRELDLERSRVMEACITRHVHEPNGIVCIPGREAKLERLCRSRLFAAHIALLRKPTLQVPCNVEVLFQATLALSCSPFEASQKLDYMNFFLMHHDVRLHSLVWMTLLWQAFCANIFRQSDPGPTISALYAKLLMVLLPEQVREHCDTEIQVTLSEAIHGHPQPFIWQELLDDPMFQSFDDVEGSSSLPASDRFLIVAGKFALLRLKETPAAVERRAYFELLNCVLRCLSHVTGRKTSTEFYNKLSGLIIAVAKNDPLSLSLMVEDEAQLCPKLCNDCLRLILELYRAVDTYLILKALNPHIILGAASSGPYPSLHIVMQFSVQLWFLSDAEFSRLPWDHDYLISCRRDACEIMSAALGAGHEDAYRLFIDGSNWMELLSPLWVFSWVQHEFYKPQVIRDYINGLKLITSESAQQTFVEHLHTPRNLIICCLTLYHDIKNLQKLIDLRPDHQSWVGCRCTMRAVLSWMLNSAREASDFPLLDFLLQGRVGVLIPLCTIRIYSLASSSFGQSIIEV